MRKSQKSLFFDLAVFVGSLSVLGYFGWHGFYGPRSFTHAEQIKLVVSEQRAIVDKLEQQKKTLNARVALLRPQSIDPDMLDEQARKRLEFAKNGDILSVDLSK